MPKKKPRPDFPNFGSRKYIDALRYLHPLRRLPEELDVRFDPSKHKKAGLAGHKLDEARIKTRIKLVMAVADQRKLPAMISRLGLGKRELQGMNFDAAKLKALGANATMLGMMGFTFFELRAAGFSERTLKAIGLIH